MDTNAQLIPAGPHLPVAIDLPVEGTMIAFPTGRYAIPDEDMAEFAGPRVGDEERERIKFLLALFAKMEAGGIVPMSEALGFQYRAVRGYGASSLRGLYYKWKQLGWRGLVRKWTNGAEQLPTEFVEHLKALYENNGRSMRQAQKALFRDWYNGKDIPGFGTWPEYYATVWPDRDLPATCPGVPSGWSKTNLYRLQPSTAARAAKTKGLAAMKAEMPSLIRNPAGLKPLQLVVIDDFETDQKAFVNDWDPVTRTRIRGIHRMAGLAAMDVATRRIVGFILKPRLVDDKGKMQAITRAEVRLLLYTLLRDYGVPAHGMTILAEKAAAAVTAEVQTTFKNLFGGRVAVTRTSTLDQAVLKSGYKDSGGKPWLKGWLESFWNLMHNVAASLPGQKGSSYLTAPADLAEKLRLTQRLIGTGPRDAQLSDAQLERAVIPFPKVAELFDAYLQIFKWIEDRTDHELLGFDEVPGFREPGEMMPWRPWADFALIPAHRHEQMIPAPRRESPRERWDKLWPQVQSRKVERAVLMLLLLTPKKAELKSRHLTFAHQGVGYSWIWERTSPLAQLPQGSEVLVYFDPARADRAHVARYDGRYLGEVKRLGGETGLVDLLNKDEVTAAEREISALYNSELAEVRARPLHQQEEAALAAAQATNAALVEEAKQERERGLTNTLTRELPAGTEPVTPLGGAVAQRIAAAEQTARAQRKMVASEERDFDRILREAAAGETAANFVPKAAE